jgi:aminopeptidase N
LLDASAPGSDHQLAFARSFAGAARTDEHAAVLRKWLSGDAPNGLAIDTDLRWTLLARLVALGAATPDEIDLELERDDTATGRRQAATARAGIPTAEAKQLAWSEAVDGDELPNAMLSATVGGFVQPDQRELLEPFVARYFEAISRVWQERTNEIAQTITLGLYPALLASESTVEATNEFLKRDDIPSGARRLIGEGRDGVQRALRAQARDGVDG